MYTSFETKPYIYKNMPIYGGGFVTGILFHPTAENRLYIRTDIGGAYRYDFEKGEWLCLCEYAHGFDISETYPLAIAVDEDNPDSLFVACGDKLHAWLLISNDAGKTFCKKKIPSRVHGNNPGRATGERLFYRKGRIIFGSQSFGINYSDDMGETWSVVRPDKETNISCMFFDDKSDLAIVGCNGEINASGTLRGHSLFYSTDNFESFHKLTIPPRKVLKGANYNGYVPQRIASDGKYIYITFSATGNVMWGGMGAYSCDTGSIWDGKILKYEIKNGIPEFVKDITPNDRTKGGYSAIEIKNNVLVTSTICRHGNDIIYRSFDGGETWEKILEGLEVGKVNWTVSYMKPEYNGNGSCIHWISDFKISPFNPNFAIFNTGTGIFKTENLCDEVVTFEPFCNGIEETVHMNVYSLPSGDVKVLDLVGDLGGFAFKGYDTPCENTFADKNNHRYITCVNADFPISNPQKIVCTPRGNWTGRTNGGLILTTNQCESWKHIPCPLGVSPNIDKAAEDISKPNIDSGWVAISPDGKRISWAISHECSSFMTVFSDDDGKTWRLSTFMGLDKLPLREELNVRIYTDLYKDNIAFAISKENRIFISYDKSSTFYEVETGVSMTNIRFRFSQVARLPGTPLTFYATCMEGLYRFEILLDRKIKATNILANGDFALTVGFGKGKSDTPAMYITGVICGQYGFFISDDLGESWTRINDDAHCYGNITSICGDMREYGRIILATGTKGLVYGVPDKSK